MAILKYFLIEHIYSENNVTVVETWRDVILAWRDTSVTWRDKSLHDVTPPWPSRYSGVTVPWHHRDRDRDRYRYRYRDSNGNYN